VSIFKACDIRGVVGTEFNEEIARQIGLGLGTLIAKNGGGPVCIAGDFRRSTAALKESVCKGLVAAGAMVKDAGRLPTPAAYFTAARSGCRNTAFVTASHNPGRYNGMKFMVAGRPATPELVGQLQQCMGSASEAAVPGRVEPLDLLSEYEAEVQATAARIARHDQASLARRRLTVVVDAMGGAFSEIAPRVLQAAGCRVIPLRCAVDPDFAQYDPNPAVDANLAELTRRVVDEQADFGVAFDGDGDRATLVDSNGRIIRPEQTAALFVRLFFPKPVVVYDLKCSSAITDAVRDAGGRAIMQPSGHGFIKTTMIREQSEFGVEVSGHFFFQALGGGDDGLLVALLAAHGIAASGMSLAELVEPIGWPNATPDLRLPLPKDSAAILEKIAASCGGEVSRLDGVRAEYADGWALARTSITEPLITLRFEARPSSTLKAIASRFLQSAPDLLAKVLEMI
jgi:phosphomannomutase/phosphoglucomutase